jgi:SagB-type dehydrogenase family enzyme
MSERYRRARTIALFWENGVLAGGNWFSQTYDRVDPREAAILDAIPEWTTPEDLAARDPGKLLEGDVEKARYELERLAGNGLAVRESAAEQDASAARFEEHWRTWGVGTEIFHSTARDAPYTETDDEAKIAYEQMVEQPGPPPPPVKTYPGAPRIALPRDLPSLDASLEAVLASRRTWRAFTGGEISIRRASKLLLSTFGAIAEADAGEYGHLLFKTSPSGGSRHPTECYVAALAVEGIPPGIYHYDPRHHALEQLSLGDHREDVIAWLANQYWFRGSAMVCFLTAIPSRLWYKYKHGRTYRVLLMDQGHLGQTWALTATALNLGPWQTAAFRDTLVEKALGIDGIEEVAMYALGAGITPIPVLYPAKTIEIWDKAPKKLQFPSHV